MIGSAQHTPLHAVHRALGARLVPFGGWEMPLQFSGILAEHRAVRTGAGLFDVSHLGRILVEGAEALALIQRLVTTDLAPLAVGRGRYTLLCAEDGGILDDLIVYRWDAQRFFLAVNAAPFAQTWPWVREQARAWEEVEVKDLTPSTALIAVQGPAAVVIAAQLLPALGPPSSRYGVVAVPWRGVELWIARTGYTGEDGLEIMAQAGAAPSLWEALMEAGAQPCGLGARDSLRLEAGLLLSGQDFDATVNPWEAGLERLLDLEKGEFIGRAALLRLREEGVSRRLVGFQMLEKAVPRPGCTVLADGQAIGRVTSGGYAPTLDLFLGLAYVPLEFASMGREWWVDIRGRSVPAQVVPRPFYRRPRG